MTNKIKDMTPGQILADTNVANFVETLALGIAAAQERLDQNSIEQYLRMAETTLPNSNTSLLDLGLTPAFYHFQYADIEVGLQIYVKIEEDFGFDLGLDYNTRKSESTLGDLGTASIQVLQGTGISAKAILDISANEIGEITIGSKTVQLVETGTGSGANVEVEIDDSFYETAKAFAAKLTSDPDGSPSAVPEIDRAYFEMRLPAAGITPTTTNSNAFKCGLNKVRVAWADDAHAYAYFAVTGSAAGTMHLELTDGTEADLTIGTGGPPLLGTTTTMTANNIVSHINATLAADFASKMIFSNGVIAPDEVPLFEQSEHTINAASHDKLRVIADIMTASQTMTIELIGHASTEGNAVDNMKLGLRRAEETRRYLSEELGIAAGRIVEVSSMGETQPIKPGGTEDREKSRRVEIKVVAGPKDILQVATTATAKEWHADTALSAGLGALLGTRDGTGLPTVANGDKVVIAIGGSTVELEVAASYNAASNEFEAGATAGDTATSLARLINESGDLPTVQAYAVGRIVRILPPGTTARITIHSVVAGTTANTINLTDESGSISIFQPFQEGTDPGQAAANDYVEIAGERVTVDAAGITGFAKGATSIETAKNLATVADTLAGISAEATADTVKLTGPIGTKLSTNNTKAFLISDPQIGGKTELKSESKKKASSFGASLDVHYARKYEQSVSGNSKIKVRLTSIPAPPEFLEKIGDYYEQIKLV